MISALNDLQFGQNILRTGYKRRNVGTLAAPRIEVVFQPRVDLNAREFFRFRAVRFEPSKRVSALYAVNVRKPVIGYRQFFKPAPRRGLGVLQNATFGMELIALSAVCRMRVVVAPKRHS